MEGDRAPGGLPLLAQPADLAEQGERFLGRLVVEDALDARVVEPGTGTDQGAAYGDAGQRGVGVEVELPQDGRAVLVGQQAGGALAEVGRVQRDAFVGEVEGGDAVVRLGVKGAARGDEGGHIGDGVVDAEASPGARRGRPPAAPPGEEHRLVEIEGTGRVDGEEGEVGGVLQGVLGHHRPVGGRDARGPGGALRLGLGRGREVVRNLQMPAQLMQRGTQRGLGGVGHVHMATGHTTERMAGRRRWRGVIVQPSAPGAGGAV